MKLLHNFKTALLSAILLFTVVYADNSLLVIRPSGAAFDDVVKGISGELSADFNIIQLIISENTGGEAVKAKISKTTPKIVVLMDNRSINIYRDYNDALPGSATPAPVVVCMGLFIEKAIIGLKNATGVTYEIPVITSVVNLRALLNKPVKTLGIVHREFISDFIKANVEYCKKEGITIKTCPLPDKTDNYASLVKKSLKYLLKTEQVDALWLPNDNALLTPEIIRDVWIPLINKYRKPAIVGVESLVNPVIDMGTFAVLPDHIGLGAQVAEMVYSIKENNWKLPDRKIEPPLSVIKVVNLPKLEKYFGITEDNCKNVDKILK